MTGSRGWQMRLIGREDKASRAGFLSRLARDKRGTTLAIGTAAMIPLAGMVGGGLDLSRMYMTKTRLQHACDAGALAGRRTMGGGSWRHNNNAAETAALQFFAGNWEDGAYGSQNLSRTYRESDGVVTGVASVQLPMTLMRIFNEPTKTITVTCNAAQRLLNTDVMFVLDTTGSMAETITGDTKSKLANLQVAVKCFYQILAQLDITDIDCEEPGNEPTGGVSPDVQLRFGFVPYSSNVNVGRLLPTNYFVDRWTYQSREYRNRSAWTDWRAEVERSDSSCSRANTSTTNYRNQSAYMYYGVRYCYRERQDYGPVWVYKPIEVNVSALKNGTSWRAGFTRAKIGNNAEDVTIDWDGCIEERQTARASEYYPRPTNAYDLDIDMVPVAGNDATQWRPALPQLTFLRNVLTSTDQLNRATSPETANRYLRGDYAYACPTESRRLRSYSQSGGPTDFMGYVNSLNPAGNTYHDIGMIWGQRLLSPTGLFAVDNRTSASGGAIERHIIFMTDGDTQTSFINYNAYGVPFFDRRQTDDSVAPTDADLNNQVNKRFEALCALGQTRFTIWVIGFGTLSNETLTRLQNCASPGRFFRATNGTGLQTAFRQIAEQIGQLRLVN